MTFGQRMMLLCSLFFFFGMGLFAIADWGGKKTAAVMVGNSVLHYPADIAAETALTVPCYAGDSYERFKAAKAGEGFGVAVSGDLSDGDKMQIHVRSNGDYFVIVEGPDKAGATEGCQVTEGWKFSHPLTAGAAPAAVQPAP